MYLFIEDKDIEKVEEMLNDACIKYTTQIDPLFYTLDKRARLMIENNIFVDNIEDINELINFIYDDFNPLDIDAVIFEKMAMYESGRK